MDPDVLRVLHIVPYFEHAWAYGGIPRAVTPLVRGLADRGHAITVWTTDAAASDRRLPSELMSAPDSRSQLRVFRNLSNRAAYHWQLFLPRGFSACLRRSAAAFDIVHVHACHNLLSGLAARHCHGKKIPFVVQPHGTAPLIERRRVAKWCFDTIVGHHALDSADAVVTVSAAERRNLIEMGVRPERIATIPNTIDEREFLTPVTVGAFRRRYGLGSAPIVLFLGKLTPRKLVDVLVRAVATTSPKDAHLVIAGPDMGAGASLRRMVEELQMTARVRFVGTMAGEQRLEALSDADVVAYPCEHEAFGLVAVEALLCGTPVVVANDNGCGELIQQTGGGLLVRPRDVAGLAAAIRTILLGRDEWRSAAGAAAVHVRERLNSSTICTQVEGLYRAILSSRDQRSAALNSPYRTGLSGAV